MMVLYVFCRNCGTDVPREMSIRNAKYELFCSDACKREYDEKNHAKG